MPLYEYRCTACDAAFERIVPADQADQVTCAACGARVRRLLSVFAAPRTGAGDPAPAAGGGGCCGGACGSC